jgi:hypothetical protein
MKPRYILQFLYLPDPELFRDAIAAIPPNQRLASRGADGMKVQSITMSQPTVRALLANNKTQTMQLTSSSSRLRTLQPGDLPLCAREISPMERQRQWPHDCLYSR